MNEEIFVLDHGVHEGQERALPLLLLGEPALDERHVGIRFVVSHAVSCVFARRKKTERVPSLGMVLKSSRDAKRGDGQGERPPPQCAGLDYFVAGVLAASSFSAKLFC